VRSELNKDLGPWFLQDIHDVSQMYLKECSSLVDGQTVE